MENIDIGQLANMLLMDQTTVTRNIEILRKKGYVNFNFSSIYSIKVA